jgi:hypothetical protein
VYIHIEIITKFKLIREREWTGDTDLIFIRDTVYPERPTTNGITDANRKELKVYQITLEGLIISSTRR